MPTQTSSNDPKLTQTDSPSEMKFSGFLVSTPQAKKSRGGQRHPALARAARVEASRKYRWKNEEELREKAQIRMAAKAIKERGSVSQKEADSIKNAHTTYRSKKRELLAFKQRVRRQDAFIAKHGHQAHQDRLARQRAREDAEWEAKRAEAEAARAAHRTLTVPSK
ncbi:hypothetical protein B0H13DRAFT_1905090 [Mycena leptocephala]|nr:hypothetical protein B0H13DRAFT_1905090 [Mycena leptocephala]